MSFSAYTQASMLPHAEHGRRAGTHRTEDRSPVGSGSLGQRDVTPATCKGDVLGLDGAVDLEVRRRKDSVQQ